MTSHRAPFSWTFTGVVFLILFVVLPLEPIRSRCRLVECSAVGRWWGGSAVAGRRWWEEPVAVTDRMRSQTDVVNIINLSNGSSFLPALIFLSQ